MGAPPVAAEIITVVDQQDEPAMAPIISAHQQRLFSLGQLEAAEATSITGDSPASTVTVQLVSNYAWAARTSDSHISQWKT